MMIESVQQQLVQAILDANRKQAKTILETWKVEHGFERTLSELLDPALKIIGERWEQAMDVSLAQGYVAGKIAEDFMANPPDLLRLREHADIHGTAVIGNIEDDYHSFGRKLLGIFLRATGWNVCDLDNDVPAADFVDNAEESGARVIGVSAMMYTTAMNIIRVREELEKRGLSRQIKLAVGGAVFRLRPELVAEVGGDGTAGNAINAPELFERLWRETE